MVKLTAENRFLQKKGDGNYEVETKIKRKKKNHFDLIFPGGKKATHSFTHSKQL